jgi:hypothetical protein
MRRIPVVDAVSLSLIHGVCRSCQTSESLPRLAGPAGAVTNRAGLIAPVRGQHSGNRNCNRSSSAPVLTMYLRNVPSRRTWTTPSRFSRSRSRSVRERGGRNVELSTDVSHDQVRRVSVQEQPDDAQPGFRAHGGQHVRVAGDVCDGYRGHPAIYRNSISIEIIEEWSLEKDWPRILTKNSGCLQQHSAAIRLPSVWARTGSVAHRGRVSEEPR